MAKRKAPVVTAESVDRMANLAAYYANRLGESWLEFNPETGEVVATGTIDAEFVAHTTEVVETTAMRHFDDAMSGRKMKRQPAKPKSLRALFGAPEVEVSAHWTEAMTIAAIDAANTRLDADSAPEVAECADCRRMSASKFGGNCRAHK